MNKSDIGTAIRKRRKQLGLRQQEVADLADININSLIAIERGTGNPKIDTILAVLEIIGFELTLIN